MFVYSAVTSHRALTAAQYFLLPCCAYWVSSGWKCTWIPTFLNRPNKHNFYFRSKNEDDQRLSQRKNGRLLRLPFQSSLKIALLLADCFQPCAQPGLVPRRGILVDHALLDGLIERRDGLAEQLVDIVFVAGGQRLAELADCTTQTSLVAAVNYRLSFRLPGPLQGRIMIRHNLLRYPSVKNDA